MNETTPQQPPQTETSQDVAYDTEYHTDIPVGEILRRARMHYGLSLDDVEASLRIRSALLGALEQSDVSGLPGKAYAIGFVRSYSEFLGLDGDQMVKLYKRQSGGGAERPTLALPVPASESKMPSPIIMAAAAGGLLFVVVLIALFVLVPDREKIPDVPEEMKVAAAPEQETATTGFVGTPEIPGLDEALGTEDFARETGAAEASPTPAGKPSETEATPMPVPGSDESRIVVRAIENSWVEIRDSSDNILVSRVLEKGNYYLLPDDASLVMDTGSVGALEIVLDGVKLPPFGKVGEIARSISLDPAQLKLRAQGLR